jgi:HAD superfamily phosphatase (TIGR01668 family)
MPGWLLPDFQVDSVGDLSREMLREWGVETLLLDVDCTLKPYRSRSLSPEVIAWLTSMQLAGIRLCLVSNGRAHRVQAIAAQGNLPFVAPAWKPAPFGLWRAIRRLDADRKTTAMVGDQIFADVLAARLAGVKSILVKAIFPEQEPWWTRLKRPFESLVIGRWGKMDSSVRTGGSKAIRPPLDPD